MRCYEPTECPNESAAGASGHKAADGLRSGERLRQSSECQSGWLHVWHLRKPPKCDSAADSEPTRVRSRQCSSGPDEIESGSAPPSTTDRHALRRWDGNARGGPACAERRRRYRGYTCSSQDPTRHANEVTTRISLVTRPRAAVCRRCASRFVRRWFGRASARARGWLRIRGIPKAFKTIHLEARTCAMRQDRDKRFLLPRPERRNEVEATFEGPIIAASMRRASPRVRRRGTPQPATLNPCCAEWTRTSMARASS